MKKVFFFLALMSAMSISAATKYCGETITGVNHGHKASISCECLGGDSYLFTFESEDEILGYNAAGSNFYANVNGTGGYQVSNHMTQSGNTLTCTITSSAVPTLYAGAFYVNYSDGEEKYDIPTDADFSAKCSSGTVAVTAVSLNKTEMEIAVGRKVQLTALFEPVNASNRNVTWTSSKPEVATVVDGLVEAIAEGDAVITVTTEDGAKTATCAVTVTPKTEEVVLEKDGIEISYTAYAYDNDVYELTITSEKELANIGGSYWHVNGEGTEALNTKIVADEDPHTIVVRTESTSAPQLYTPLYIMMPGEVNFGQITIEWISKRSTATSVETISSALVRKSIINGQLILTIDGIDYTAQGQMVK